VSVHSAPSSCLRVNGAPDASPLQDFAIETDALLSDDSVHYQDYSVNRAPIRRALRAQTGVSAYGRQLMASADVNEPVETDSRLHSQDVRLVAGHVSATLDEGTGGDVGGHVPFLLSSTHYFIYLGLSNKGRPYGCLRRAATTAPSTTRACSSSSSTTRPPTSSPRCPDARVTRLTTGSRMRGRTCCGTS